MHDAHAGAAHPDSSQLAPKWRRIAQLHYMLCLTTRFTRFPTHCTYTLYSREPGYITLIVHVTLAYIDFATFSSLPANYEPATLAAHCANYKTYRDIVISECLFFFNKKNRRRHTPLGN